MSEGVDELHRMLGSDLDGAEFQAAVANLTEMSAAERVRFLGDLATDGGVDAVPVLEKLARLGGPLAVDAAQVLPQISDAASASALRRIANSTSGEVRKTARRGLHRLASRGVRPEQEPREPAERRPLQDEETATVLASPIDGAGNRGIWFAFKHGGDVDFVTVLTSDQEGVKDAFVRDMSSGRFEREARKVLENQEFPWIEMPADYARHLLDVAHRLNAGSGTPLPVEFLAWRDRIARSNKPVEQPIIYSVVSAGAVRWDPRYLDNSGRLYESDLFKSWILDKDDLTDFVKERLSAERSGLVLAGVSGEARDQMIEERAIQKLFDSKTRSLYKGRLEEMAYLLWKLGRLEMAKSALAAALALEPTDRPLTDHPFVKELMHWSLEIVTEMARGERTRAIKPGIQLHLPY